MSDQPVVVAYNATEEAADGLALAELLAGFTGAEVIIARVLRDMLERPGGELDEQREVRRRTMETRRAVVAALPSEAGADIVPLLDSNLARSLHGFAASERAALLVVGSSHLHGLGRRLLGGSAQRVIDGAHCPVAVAPPGFRTVRDLDPPVITAACDGRPHSRAALSLAASLAACAGVPLRVVTVARPVPGEEPGVPAAAERVRLAGDPRRALLDETARTGLLVMGSHGREGLRRALLGSVSARVVHDARCPVIICPPDGGSVSA